MTVPNQVFTAFAFLGFLCCAIPLPWHLEAWNTGTCLFMIWTGLGCLNQFINSIVWNGNAINWAPAWCDISTKFIIGASVGIPASSLCINRRLFRIATVKTVTISRAEKRKAVYVDLAIGVGLPVLEMILHYVAQGHRFNILEDIGCLPHTYNTWVAYVLVFLPPILIGCVSAVYSILSIIAFNQRRNQFKELLSCHSNLSSGRYLRLMALAGFELLCTLPIACYILAYNAMNNPLYPWVSWADTHFRFSRVDNIPASFWRANPTAANNLELTRGLYILCAALFFAFFGFADEAMRNYRCAVQSISKRVGVSTLASSGTFFKFGSGGTSGTSGTSHSKGTLVGSSSDGGKWMTAKSVDGEIRRAPSIPIFVHKEVLSRHDSLASSKLSNIGPGDVDVMAYLPEEKASDVDSQFALTLTDVGGTVSSVSSPSDDYFASPSPSPFLTRVHSHSTSNIAVVPPPEQAHTPDVV